MEDIVVTGGSNGLGQLIIEKLCNDRYESGIVDFSIYNLDCDTSAMVKRDNVTNIFCDISKYESIIEVSKEIRNIDILINNAGANHISYLENLDENNYDYLMNTNSKSIYLTSKIFLEKLTRSKGTILNIVSNASHIPMTNSLAYNASKGAAHIMTLQLARELTKKNGITVFGISPNKLKDTKMSAYINNRVPQLRGWTEEQAEEYQKSALVTGEETDPEKLAEFISYLLFSKENHKYLSGCILPYGA